MSFGAIRWALSQSVQKSSAKFVLVAMADCVNSDGVENMVCWPSCAHLAELTGQDIKTVEAGLKRLRDAGFIADTGMRKGTTKQVIVYELKTPVFGGVDALPTIDGSALNTPVFPDNTPVFGGVATKGKTPVFPGKDPRFSHETPPFFPETPPKTGDGTSKEPVKEPVKEQKTAQAPFVLPDWIPSDAWSAFMEIRKAKKAKDTPYALRLLVSTLTQIRADGHSPIDALNKSIKAGWSDVYPPKLPAQVAPKPAGKHFGFQHMNYREGVNADGTLA